MIVADTHAFIWWMADDPVLSRRARDVLDHDASILVPAIVCWEIALLAAKQRIRLAPDVAEFLERALDRPRIRLEPITPRIAVRANSFGDALHRDPADRLIVATAIELGAPLVTRDAKLHAFAELETIW